MKKVFLRFYDLQNFGDDLFLHIITSRYANQFTVTSKAPTAILKRKNVTVFSNKLMLLFFRFIEKYVYPKNFLTHWLINRNDIYAYVGGSLFIDNGDTKHWQNERTFYKQLKKPYYILGSNFGPSHSNEYTQLVRDILAGAQDVCFRDSASYALFKDLQNVRLSTDIAFTLDTSPYKTEAEKLAIFSIIDCSERFDAAITDKYDLEIIKLSQHLVNQGYRVMHMSFCKSEGDEAAIQRIRTKMQPKLADAIETYNYEGNLHEALTLLAKSDIIVGGRFHASVLGLLFAKKVLPMAYSDKTINLLRDLHFKGDVVDIRAIQDFDGMHVDFNNIPVQDMRQQIEYAQSQFSELDKVLTKK